LDAAPDCFFLPFAVTPAATRGSVASATAGEGGELSVRSCRSSSSRLPPRLLNSSAPAADTKVAATRLRTSGSLASAASREPPDCFFDFWLDCSERLGFDLPAKAPLALDFLDPADLPLLAVPAFGPLLRRWVDPFFGPGFLAIFASVQRLRRAERPNGSERRKLQQAASP
jgi:hypothetical protein